MFKEAGCEDAGESYCQHELYMFISNALNIGFVDISVL